MRIKITLGLISLFFAGVVVGTVGTTYYTHNKAKELFGLRGPYIAREFILKRLTKRLELTESQQQQMNSLMITTQKEIAEKRIAMIGEIQVTTNRAFEDARKFLSPEQVTKLEQFRKRVERRLTRIVSTLKNREDNTAVASPGPGIMEETETLENDADE